MKIALKDTDILFFLKNNIIKVVGTDILNVEKNKIFNTYELKPKDRKHQQGYLAVSIKHPVTNKFKLYLVHKIIYINSYGVFDIKLQMNHKDGNKHNNDINNLEVVTASQNVKHAYATNLMRITDKVKMLSSKRVRGELNVNAAFKDEQIKMMRNTYKNWSFKDVRQLMTKYKVSRRTITNILKNKSYKHLIQQ